MKPLDSSTGEFTKTWIFPGSDSLHRPAERVFFPACGEGYFCTVLLQYLSAAEPQLVFKGGTCLAKVHDEFFRMSEDLDS